MSQRIISLSHTSELDPNQSNFGVYSNRLDEIYNDPDLRNIAMIGKRGSGKSSILHSYDKKLHGGKEKFLYISLIDFEKNDDDKQNNQNSEQFKKRLEYSLLCQILARCTDSDLRRSCIKGIPVTSSSITASIFWFLYLFFTSIVIFGLVFHDRFGTVLKTIEDFPEDIIPYIHTAGYLLAFILVFCGVWWLLCKNSMRFRFSKFGIKLGATEAEINPAEHYCLDQYKFEIIHILDIISQGIGYTVVFEDMERLDSEICVEIMTKLRELNVLLNMHRLTQDRKRQSPLKKIYSFIFSYLYGLSPYLSSQLERMISMYMDLDPDPVPTIRFIYALSDEVFDGETRTKFYDTIIPVIPALNNSNVREVFVTLLQRNESWINSPQDVDVLLDIVAPELTDFRTVRNVVSEFSILKDIAEDNLGTELTDPKEYTRLLALSVYKVLFPQEYADTFDKPIAQELPLPDRKHHSKSRIAMVKELKERNLLDNSSLKMVGYSEIHLRYQRIDIIKNGAPASKNDLLRQLIAHDDPWIRKKIIGLGLLFDENSKDTINLMAEFLYPTAKDCIKALMAVYLQNSIPSLLRYLLFLKLKPHANILATIKPPQVHKGFNSKPTFVYLRLMNALSRFSEEEISKAANEIGYEEVNLQFSVWLIFHSFGSPLPSWCFPSDEYKDLDKLFTRTILPCMGDCTSQISPVILRKKFGFKTIKKHIEEYSKTRNMQPCS